MRSGCRGGLCQPPVVLIRCSPRRAPIQLPTFLGCRGLGPKLLVPFRPQDFHLSVKREEPRTDALIFLNDTGYGSGDGALADETLKLFIGAQAQHFFAATGRVSFPEVEENDVEEALEFKRRLG